MPLLLSRSRRWLPAVVLVAAAGCSSAERPSVPTPGTGPPATGPAVSAPAATSDAGWTTYQNGNSRLGVAPAQPSLGPLHRLWTADLDGQAVYGQPLVDGGRVIVATEGDDIYALDGHSGAVQWKVSIGSPLRHVRAETGCGNIDPLGITSTPVIDPRSDVVYAVGETSTGGSAPVQHVMVGVSVPSGQMVSRSVVDPAVPPGEDVLHLLQRPALALGNGRVYIAYGGQSGDCGDYHGWVVTAPVAGGSAASFNVTPSSSGGALWGGGAGPSIAANGHVYVTTGNPNSAGPSPWAEATLELAPTLGAAPLAVFADRAATGDLDLSAGTAVLLPDGHVFAAGKTDIGFVLKANGLGPVAAIHGLCGSDPDGGIAWDASLDALYVPCRGGGLQQVLLSGPRLGWKAGSVNSTPILVDGSLWAASYPDGTIEELAPATGQVLWRGSAGRKVPNFVSMSAVDGVLLVPTTAGLEAFARR